GAQHLEDGDGVRRVVKELTQASVAGRLDGDQPPRLAAQQRAKASEVVAEQIVINAGVQGQDAVRLVVRPAEQDDEGVGQGGVNHLGDTAGQGYGLVRDDHQAEVAGGQGGLEVNEGINTPPDRVEASPCQFGPDQFHR